MGFPELPVEKKRVGDRAIMQWGRTKMNVLIDTYDSKQFCLPAVQILWGLVLPDCLLLAILLLDDKLFIPSSIQFNIRDDAIILYQVP